jgi:hypothetical protein
LTHAERLADTSTGLPPALRAAMQREIIYTRLGATFVDLPFYTNIWTMMLGYYLEHPAEPCPFAQRMHRDRPDLFTWHVLQVCRRESSALSEAQRLAFLGGFLSHVALDLELHPLVNWCARRDVILHGGVESHQHRLAEKYQSLFFHREVLGADILGVPRLFTEQTQIVEHTAFFNLVTDRPVIRWSADLLAEFCRGEAPGPRDLASWIRAFRHFALSISLPIAKENSNRLGNAENRALYYDNADFRFMDHYRRAHARSVELLELAHAIWRSGDLSPESKASFLQRAQITNLAEPPERGLPPLPARPPRVLTPQHA